MISYSPKELSGLTEEEKVDQFKILCTEAVKHLSVNLSGTTLPLNPLVAVYTLFLQHLGPATAFHEVKGFCSMDNYRIVSTTSAPKLSNSNAQTFISAQYTNRMLTRPQIDLISFLFRTEQKNPKEKH